MEVVLIITGIGFLIGLIMTIKERSLIDVIISTFFGCSIGFIVSLLGGAIAAPPQTESTEIPVIVVNDVVYYKIDNAVNKYDGPIEFTDGGRIYIERRNYDCSVWLRPSSDVLKIPIKRDKTE